MMQNDVVEHDDESGGGGAATMVVVAGGGGGGGQRKGNLQGLKKGPWTAAEDAILTEYVRRRGEGNWNSVQKNCGLMRCGKSCRLRWANHLRPNLKKGAFTPEEERVIIELHFKYGNKWARMATQLPGRTDNEIKNYWNTRMKRRHRAGLPMYPREFLDQTASFHMQQRQQQEHNFIDHNNNMKPSSSLFSVFCKATTPDYNPCDFSLSADKLADFSSSAPGAGESYQGHNSHHNNLICSTNYHQHQQQQYINSQNGVVLAPLSLSPPVVSAFAPPQQLIVFGQSSASPAIDQLHGGGGGGGGGGESYPNNVISFTSLIMGDYEDRNVDQLESFSFASASELPSLQTPPRSASSNAATSCVGRGVCITVEEPDNANCNSNSNNNGGEVVRDGNDEISHEDGVLIGGNMVIGDNNSGMLDVLLQESKSIMCRKRKADDRDISSPAGEDEGKRLCNPTMFRIAAGSNEQLASDGGWWDPRGNFISSLGHVGMELKEKAEVMAPEEMSSTTIVDDDDLLSLLANFPSSVPLPEWYRGHHNNTTNDDNNNNSNNVNDYQISGIGGGFNDHQV